MKPVSVSAVAILAVLLSAASAQAQSPPEGRTMSKLQAATSLAPMLERVLPGVVSILVTGERLRPATLSAAGIMEDKMPTEPFAAGGSGVVVDSDNGYIITNNHVIANATRIDVAFSDGRVVEGKLLGTDAATDVAVVQVPLKNLTTVPFGSSDQLRIGDFVAAVGAPYGLEGSASQGIVSALMRTDIGYEIFEDFIQVDAAINPGNSGGALVNVDGELVGINTASGAQKLRTQGIAFAIPVDLARQVATELVTKGIFKRGSLGIISENLNFQMASQMGLNITRGAVVKLVVPGSPAARVGIKKGDVITAVGNKPVRGQPDYAARVSTTPIGKPLALEVLSGGTKTVHNLTIADLTIPPMSETPPMALQSLEGLSLGAMLPGFKSFGVIQGARVLAVGTSSIGKSGLKADDVITKVDMTAIRAPQDVYDSAESKTGKYRLEVDRDGKRLWIWAGN